MSALQRRTQVQQVEQQSVAEEQATKGQLVYTIVYTTFLHLNKINNMSIVMTPPIITAPVWNVWKHQPCPVSDEVQR